jgi:hypothetical protein
LWRDKTPYGSIEYVSSIDEEKRVCKSEESLILSLISRVAIDDSAPVIVRKKGDAEYDIMRSG